MLLMLRLVIKLIFIDDVSLFQQRPAGYACLMVHESAGGAVVVLSRLATTRHHLLLERRLMVLLRWHGSLRLVLYLMLLSPFSTGTESIAVLTVIGHLADLHQRLPTRLLA